MLESGKHPQNNRPLIPSIETYQKIANGMGIPLEELLHLVDGDERVSVGSLSGMYDLAKETAQRNRILNAFDSLPPEVRDEYINLLEGVARTLRSQGNRQESE